MICNRADVSSPCFSYLQVFLINLWLGDVKWQKQKRAYFSVRTADTKRRNGSSVSGLRGVEYICRRKDRQRDYEGNNISVRSVRESVREAKVVPLSEVTADDDARCKTGIHELDRVLGGGIVPGSLVLVGGDPGIGKSTLLLQVCRMLSKDKKVLYISGEESQAQIKLRQTGWVISPPSCISCARQIWRLSAG